MKCWPFLLLLGACAPLPPSTGEPANGTEPSEEPQPMLPAGCESELGEDVDGDGFLQGVDCNDCAASVYPGAREIPGNGVDEDCDGRDAVAESEVCDQELLMDSAQAEHAAMAIGLCRFVAEDGTEAGVLSARFTNASDTEDTYADAQIGLLDRFGTLTPPEGGAMLALSSGTARGRGQPGYTDDCDEFNENFEDDPPVPLSSPSCLGEPVSGYTTDSVALELRLRAPANATGFRFNANFYTYEYPNYICDEYNDYFAVFRQDEASGAWSNIMFDRDDNAVSVNSSLLEVCRAGTHGGKTFACTQGTEALAGTGFEGDALCGSDEEYPSGAATGWLRTIASVRGGEVFTLRFAIWDAGDSTLDSLALIDAFEWIVEDVVPPGPTTEHDPLI